MALVPGGLSGKLVWGWLGLAVRWWHPWRLPREHALLAASSHVVSCGPGRVRIRQCLAQLASAAVPGPAGDHPGCQAGRLDGDPAARQVDAVQLAVRADAEQVRDRIAAEARSNPLALLELPRGLRPAELAGGFGLAATSPPESRIEDSFHRQFRVLPRDTQQLLLTAAAEPVVT